MMIRILTIVVSFLVSGVAFAQQPDTSKLSSSWNPRFIHIATVAFSHPDSMDLNAEPVPLDSNSTEFACFSLVSPSMYDDFERSAKQLAARSNSHFVLVVVCKDDDAQKGEFIKNFYQNLVETNDTSLSYKKSLDKAKKEFDHLNFKSTLIERLP